VEERGKGFLSLVPAILLQNRQKKNGKKGKKRKGRKKYILKVVEPKEGENVQEKGKGKTAPHFGFFLGNKDEGRGEGGIRRKKRKRGGGEGRGKKKKREPRSSFPSEQLS